MRCFTRYLFFLAILYISLFSSSCKREEDFSFSNYNVDSSNYVPTFNDYMRITNYWPNTPVEGKANSVTVELLQDADFIVWTKENGEVLTPPIPNGKKFKDVLTASKGKHGFIFKEEGTYILNVHLKKEESSNKSVEDFDYRGKVKIGKQAINVKIEDTNAPARVPRQAIFEIQNDSYILTKNKEETVIKELIYIDYDEPLTKEKRIRKHTFYKSIFRYDNLENSSLNNSDAHKRIVLLFPMRISNTIDKGGFILKGVKNSTSFTYYGQPTNRTDKYATSGTMTGQIINTFTPIGKKRFEATWK